MTHDQDSLPAPANETPLQGWKEIAVYLERDERTARRWETEEGLPIRRHRTDRRSSVYAYPSEMEAWRATRPPKAEGPEESQPTQVAPSSRPWVWGAVAAAFVLGAFVLFLRSPGIDPVAQAGATGVGVRTTQIYEGGTVGMVSPDGRYLSETDWVNSGDIGIRDFQTGEYRRLSDKGSWDAGYGEADRSIFSPDGKQIAYNWLTDRGNELSYELRIIDAFGDQPEARTIYFNPEFRYIQPDGWTRDNRLLVQFQRGDWSHGIGFVSIDSGEFQILKSPQGHMSGLQLSHDGRWIAYSASTPEDDNNNEVYLLAADGSVEKQATRHRGDDFVAGFAPDGKTLLFVSNRTGAYGLWGAALSPDGEASAPQILIPDVGSVGPMGVLPDGSFVYQRAMGSVDLYSTELDLETGRVLRKPRILQTDYQGRNAGPWLSSDGKRLAYFAEPPTFQLDFQRVTKRLMIRNLESGEEREVPVQSVRLNPYYGIRWSPEGRRILSATRDEQDRWGLVEVDTETGKTTQLRGNADPHSRPIGWLADGRTVLYRSESETTQGASDKTIEAIQPGQSRGTRLYAATGAASAGGIFQAVISPARDRIAWREFTKDAEAIKVMSVEGGEARIVFQPGDGLMARSIAWAPDGKALLVARNPKGRLDDGSVWIVPLDGRAAFKSELTGRFLLNLNVHPDGKTVFFQAGNRDPRIFKTENYLPSSGGATE